MKVIQLSDFHIFGEPTKLLNGYDTYQSLISVLDYIKDQKLKPDLYILTGDISQDGTRDSYLRIVKHIQSLEKPVYFLPGNHDNAEILDSFFVGKEINGDKVISFGSWAFVLLNTTVAGRESGILLDSEKLFLEQTLNQYADKNVMIFMHHHPVPVNSELMDQYILENAEVFLKLIKTHSNVRGVSFGHVHQNFEKDIDGIKFLSCPSTCMQYKPGMEKLEFDTEHPGFRYFRFDVNSFSTQVIRA